MANDVTAPQAGFGEDTNIAWLVDRERVEELPLMSKFELAKQNPRQDKRNRQGIRISVPDFFKTAHLGIAQTLHSNNR